MRLVYSPKLMFGSSSSVAEFKPMTCPLDRPMKRHNEGVKALSLAHYSEAIPLFRQAIASSRPGVHDQKYLSQLGAGVASMCYARSFSNPEIAAGHRREGLTFLKEAFLDHDQRKVQSFVLKRRPKDIPPNHLLAHFDLKMNYAMALVESGQLPEGRKLFEEMSSQLVTRSDIKEILEQENREQLGMLYFNLALFNQKYPTESRIIPNAVALMAKWRIGIAPHEEENFRYFQPAEIPLLIGAAG
jgi:hypothetical protein